MGNSKLSYASPVFGIMFMHILEKEPYYEWNPIYICTDVIFT